MRVHGRLVVYALYAYDSRKQIGVNCALWYLLFVIFPPTVYWKNVEAFFLLAFACPTASEVSEFAGSIIVPARDYPYGNCVGPYGYIGRTKRIAYFSPALPTFFPKHTLWENHFVSFFLSFVQSQYKQYVNSHVVIAHVLYMGRPIGLQNANERVHGLRASVETLIAYHYGIYRN